MNFPHKITKIKKEDRVLEIGPGSVPYFRSDVFLEMLWENEDIAITQRGRSVNPLKTDKLIVYYDGKFFPFKDKEFDYVICSHVIEHVPNVELFISEMIRVAKGGYIEYPTIYFEYIYNIDVHLNIQKFNNNCFKYISKKETDIEKYNHVRIFLEELCKKGYLNELYYVLINYSVEGFEWQDNFEYKKATSIYELCESDFDYIPSKKVPITSKVKKKLKDLIKLLKHKLR